MKKKHLTELFLFIFSVELVGAVSGLLWPGIGSILEKSLFSPPGWVFSVM